MKIFDWLHHFKSVLRIRWFFLMVNPSTIHDPWGIIKLSHLCNKESTLEFKSEKYKYLSRKNFLMSFWRNDMMGMAYQLASIILRSNQSIVSTSQRFPWYFLYLILIPISVSSAISWLLKYNASINPSSHFKKPKNLKLFHEKVLNELEVLQTMADNCIDIDYKFDGHQLINSIFH